MGPRIELTCQQRQQQHTGGAPSEPGPIAGLATTGWHPAGVAGAALAGVRSWAARDRLGPWFDAGFGAWSAAARPLAAGRGPAPLQLVPAPSPDRQAGDKPFRSRKRRSGACSGMAQVPIDSRCWCVALCKRRSQPSQGVAENEGARRLMFTLPTGAKMTRTGDARVVTQFQLQPDEHSAGLGAATGHDLEEASARALESAGGIPHPWPAGWLRRSGGGA